MHGGRKYAPTRSAVTDDSPLSVQAVHVHRSAGTPSEPPEATWPPPGAKMRNSKGGVVRAARRNASPQPASLESLEAAWSKAKAHDSFPNPQRRNSEASPAGNRVEGPPRGKKKGFRPPDVRTIFTPGERDPRVKQETGAGHSFEPGVEDSWCDHCCRYVFQHGLTCTGCKYTCHEACLNQVSLDCNSGTSLISQDQLNNNTQVHDVEKDRELRTEFSTEEIRQMIEKYNMLTKDLLKMTLGPAGVYTGFIKVQMDLRRPVTVRGRQTGAGGALVEEAFYLPRGVLNTLHISSNNTVRQVIVALLNKFTVADNPAKYALYKRCHREEQVYVCKLVDTEQPLFLRLMAGPDPDTLSFVLREQQTGEVMWDAFSVPELRNFLRILDKEEQEQREAVIRRYSLYRQRLQEALVEAQGPSFPKDLTV
ncbi:ras association domain-containing protein 1 [Betta splendens]|uniref:Ras association domain-containing protein 1 n=1 Tax=Betta splendens TaxID=158456 RepID=A0A6P7NFL5_BETSP|nr:ras association domain-containing protein 1 [Betta splendens]